MASYKILDKQIFQQGNYSLLPLRMQDRYQIMHWRNEQIYHLRQAKPLTLEDQNNYFENVVSKLFEQEQPIQLLFSFLENGACIGYGGLVHINWIDRNAEVSFIMQTSLEEQRFAEIWTNYLSLLQKVAFNGLKLNKIFTYAFDIRPHLYPVLLESGFCEEARLKDHCFCGNKFIDVLIHSKINQQMTLKLASDDDIDITFEWASNPRVRQYSIQLEPIIFENHKKWFLNKIASSNCHYFISEVNEEKIGSIRFDINEKKEALLSFLLDPEFHGNGYGKLILNNGCKELLKREDIVKIVGLVNIDNIPSIKTFKSLGFINMGETNSFISFEKVL
jgi:RimJ/RimL family protein N-acetyltransferase